MIQRNHSITNVYKYDAVGNLASSTYSNLVSTSYEYDEQNRLRHLRASRGGAAPFRHYEYAVGPAGNRTQVIDHHTAHDVGGQTVKRLVNYGYDNLYRLETKSIVGDPASYNGVIGYQYDNVGNRQARTLTAASTELSGALPPMPSYTYDGNDWLTLTDYAYDANGNTLSSPGSTTPDIDTYNFENRLTSRNGTALQVKYDADGNRREKAVGGLTTVYLVDDQNPTGYPQVFEEITGTGANQTVRSYMYGHMPISMAVLPSGSSTWSVHIYAQDGDNRYGQTVDLCRFAAS